MSEHAVTTPADARAALSSVSAMKATARRRGAWPLWLSLAVAAGFGANGVILALGQTWAHKLPATAAVLAALVLVMWVRWSRGAALRGEARRLACVTIINVVFVVFSGLVRGPLAFGGAGPTLYGALEAAVVLAALALITRAERNGFSESGQ